MSGRYKVWMTQGQGCGEFPDAVFDTLEEALDEARGMFGEGSVGIELPDGSWHKFGPEWDMRAKVTMLRMRKDGLNPKQEWLLKRWQEPGVPGRWLVRSFQGEAHTFQTVLHYLKNMLKPDEAENLFMDSLAWGLFDIFECPTGMMPTNEQIDWLVARGKGQG